MDASGRLLTKLSYRTKAWADSLDPSGKSGVSFLFFVLLYLGPINRADIVSEQIRFLGDPSGEFTKALDLSFESSAIFGNDRSKRYVLLVEDGKVKEAFVEPDNTGLDGMSLFCRAHRSMLT